LAAADLTIAATAALPVALAARKYWRMRCMALVEDDVLAGWDGQAYFALISTPAHLRTKIVLFHW
jgi:hypothetical protein